MSSLSKHVFILNSKRVIRSIIQKCVRCRRLTARSETQLTGQLPAEE